MVEWINGFDQTAYNIVRILRYWVIAFSGRTRLNHLDDTAQLIVFHLSYTSAACRPQSLNVDGNNDLCGLISGLVEVTMCGVLRLPSPTVG